MSTEEIKEENKIEEKPAKPKRSTKVASVTKDEVKTEKVEKPEEVDILADLPDSVKKKLEQIKIDKAKSKNAKRKVRKKKEARHVKDGKIFVQATYNNTIITITDRTGSVISWASAGLAGFKGPRKSTSYAAQIITKIAIQKARELGLENAEVYVKGVGTGREAAVRTINAVGVNVTAIRDITPVPHNGCRPRKPRRI